MCDSQESPLPPTRKLQLLKQQATVQGTLKVSVDPQSPCTCQAVPESGADLATEPLCSQAEVRGNADKASCIERPPRLDPNNAAQQSSQLAANNSLSESRDHQGVGPTNVPGQICSKSAGVHDPVNQLNERLRQLEVQHVHRVYEAIAPHFSATRCVLDAVQFWDCCFLSNSWTIAGLIPVQLASSQNV
jgi:hypothetical protein